MEKRISYLNRTFEDYKDALIEFSERYYPDLNTSYDDASVSSWMIDLVADVSDNLSYHIDRVYQETNLESAQEIGSLYAIARNNGVKIPGPKGSMAEVKISFVLPAQQNAPNYYYAPIVKRGTRFSSASQQFELLTDIDFSKQFDENGNSDRIIVPRKNTNGLITGYTVSKLAVVTAGETMVYRQVVHAGDIKPFMEIVIPVENVMNIESILVKDGTDATIAPTYRDFYSSGCPGNERYYEVDSLSQSWSWMEKEEEGRPVTYTYGYDVSGNSVATYCVTKGEWRYIDHKFITEYTDKGYMKITFGCGVEGANINIDSESSMADFSKWQITKIMNNSKLGILPKPESTIFILYRVGGGKASNVAKGSINRVSYLNADFRGDRETASVIMKTMEVENTTPSISGKDMPSAKEMKYLIKYHNAAQERCVTVKDYIDRILMLPPKYGTPFRVGVMEENNKIMVYLLGIDYEGKLDASLPVTLVKNIENYLAGYRCINDYVEIKAGRIINLSIDVNVIIDKNYDKSDVVKEIIETVKNYMDVNSHIMGEEIYISDLEKEISKIDGVISLIGLNIYNETGNGYSQSHIAQETLGEEMYTKNDLYYGGGDNNDYYYVGDGSRELIDIDATDGILYNEGDTMMEIKNPDNDIRVRVKER